LGKHSSYNLERRGGRRTEKGDTPTDSLPPSSFFVSGSPPSRCHTTPPAPRSSSWHPPRLPSPVVVRSVASSFSLFWLAVCLPATTLASTATTASSSPRHPHRLPHFQWISRIAAKAVWLLCAGAHGGSWSSTATSFCALLSPCSSGSMTGVHRGAVVHRDWFIWFPYSSLPPWLNDS
jgi:hypothetical protein